MILRFKLPMEFYLCGPTKDALAVKASFRAYP